jgi:hypothetical protein
MAAPLLFILSCAGILAWLLLHTTERSLAKQAKATSDTHQRRMARRVKRAWISSSRGNAVTVR